MSFYTITTLPDEIKRVSPLRHAAATHSHRFSFFAEPLLFQTNHPALLDIAHTAFGRFPPADGEPLVLQMYVTESTQHTALSTQHSVRVKPTIHQQGHLFYLAYGTENTLVVDLQGGYSFGVVNAAALQDPDFIRYNLLETAAHAMSSYGRGYVAIHAAAVIKNNRALLLTGPSGVGKSTLAFACIRQGFQALAEDVVQVKIKPDGLQFWGVPWQFHLLPDVPRFFPELSGLSPQHQSNGEWKLEVDLERYYPGSTITHVDEARLVFLQRAQPDEPARLERLAPEQARKLFEVVWAWETGWKKEYDHRLNCLMTQGAYQLFIGSSPDETARRLVKIVRD